MPNCITGSITPYTGEWGRKQIQHLYNRLGNGASLEEIEDALTKTPAELVDELIDAAMVIPPMEDNEHCPFLWAYPSDTNHYPHGAQDKNYQLQSHFVGGLIHNPVRYKLTLFWHNHFVTETPETNNNLIRYHFLYYRLLHQHTWGNFKTFTQEMGLDPYMLIYLSGRVNIAAQPNENYARELLELFTLGVDNYSQSDVENVAKGLTGWKVNVYNPPYSYYPGDTVFVPNDHDWGSLTLFNTYNYSPTGNDEAAALAGYEWIHDTIFEAKGTTLARHICRKFYKYYVYEEPNEDIVNELAEIFKNSGWQIDVVFRELFKSEHFYSPAAFGVQIKSPLELFSMVYKQTGLVHNQHWFMVRYGLHEDYNPDYPFHIAESLSVDSDIPSADKTPNNALINVARAGGLGQLIFLPPSVAGWPGGQAWINESTMVNRSFFLSSLLVYVYTFPYTFIHPNVINSINYHLEQMVISIANRIGTAEPQAMTEAIIDHYMMVRPSEEHIGYAVNTLVGDIPTNYIEDGTWIYEEFAAPQFKQLLGYLFELPAFQLN